jgi:uncharacterized protein
MTPIARYLDGVPCFVDTSQPDVEAAQRFYGGLFGWRFEQRMPDYWMATLDGLDVAGMAQRPDASWNTYIQVASADQVTADAMQLGAQVLVPPFDVGVAGRMSVIADPTGAAFCTWEPREHHGAQLVNAAGSWNWSDLQTPDPSLAEPFYRALEARTPGTRAMHEAAGAPEGFTDAIGWLQQDDGPSRWAVTFSVADTDVSAALVTELGGEVVVPPYDAGPTRVAQVRDPAGVVFTISHYDSGR